MISLPNSLQKKPAAKGIASPVQKELVESFFKIPDSRAFYLAGGTALSEYYLGHRKSFDLDFFTSQENLVMPFAYSLENSLKKDFQVSVTRVFESFAEMICKSGDEEVKIQMAYDSPFHFEPPVNLAGIIVNDYADLVIDKFLTFFGRHKERDVIDLYVLLENEKLEFWELAELARQKDPGFDLYWMARACEKISEFPDEMNAWRVDTFLPLDAKTIKKFFHDLGKEIFRRISNNKSE